MKTVIEMARDQGLPETEMAGVFIVNQDDLERLVELARADEREACAKVCDDWPNGRDDVYSIGVAIRARSNT